MLFGNEKSFFERMKHVIVDEMQDYSMVQYEILNTLFQCKMTILGDVNQVVDRNNATLIDNLQNIFGEKATLVKMMKSYRSTYEISEFCRKMCNLSDAESFERHGEAPSIEEYDDYDSMVKEIQKKIDNVDLSAITTMVVICKTASAAQQLYENLEDSYKGKCYLMNDESSNFNEGIIITNSMNIIRRETARFSILREQGPCINWILCIMEIEAHLLMILNMFDPRNASSRVGLKRLIRGFRGLSDTGTSVPEPTMR